MPSPPLSSCSSTYDYGEVSCEAVLHTDGTVTGKHCGEPCSWIMQKSGHGLPPFNWRRKLFAGDVELPNQEWIPA